MLARAISILCDRLFSPSPSRFRLRSLMGRVERLARHEKIRKRIVEGRPEVRITYRVFVQEDGISKRVNIQEVAETSLQITSLTKELVLTFRLSYLGLPPNAIRSSDAILHGGIHYSTRARFDEVGMKRVGDEEIDRIRRSLRAPHGVTRESKAYVIALME
ncbi:hypothetical protein MJO28_017049 [Puccinia striiformis f. sp. tritici]|nr:hypothetical protein MJO28_017049 [Puccinia striiformis f. sp. tritici]KAI7950919.1 hypothetical protein MJO29_009593 [Puccinia striiformis f. sp. tritici]